MDEPPKLRRHGFRFSLRMLFAVVTALACGPAYHFNWIRERHRMLNDGVVLGEPAVGRQTVHAPGPLPVFGEVGYARILYLPDYAADDDVAAFYVLRGKKPSRRLTVGEVEHLQATFPEAELRSFVSPPERTSQCSCFNSRSSRRASPTASASSAQIRSERAP